MLMGLALQVRLVLLFLQSRKVSYGYKLPEIIIGQLRLMLQVYLLLFLAQAVTVTEEEIMAVAVVALLHIEIIFLLPPAKVIQLL
jgi:hypothetical protein